jgi:hypothetical protein
MSLYWDLRCVDCGVDAGISNANRMMKEMQGLAAGAADLGRAFKAITKLVDGELLGIRLLIDYGSISLPVEFFLEHGEHRVRPVDECGRFDTPCGITYRCSSCGTDFVCCEREHPGMSHTHHVGNVWHSE